MKGPEYDGGAYCVEHMELGIWRKKKTGRFLSRNWNHITLDYALYHARSTRRHERGSNAH